MKEVISKFWHPAYMYVFASPESRSLACCYSPILYVVQLNRVNSSYTVRSGAPMAIEQANVDIFPPQRSHHPRPAAVTACHHAGPADSVRLLLTLSFHRACVSVKLRGEQEYHVPDPTSFPDNCHVLYTVSPQRIIILCS